jgi:Asp-tRNA(Asn)/Glu-tRNA(Gln) amidotransferase B subunit
MSEDRKRILDMLAKGKITAAEAEKLIDAIASPENPGAQNLADKILGRDDIKYLYVKVDSEEGDKVDVRVPLSLVRSGMRLTSLIPPLAMDEVNTALQEHGMSFDLSNLKDSDIEELITGLKEMEVNVNSKDGDNVKVYCA